MSDGEPELVAQAQDAAGMLAEAGIVELEFVRSGAVQERLRARETDLPSVLSSLRPNDTLRSPDGRVSVVKVTTGQWAITWAPGDRSDRPA